MATLNFVRGNISNRLISDGQFLIDTALNQLYTDVGTSRLHLGGVVEVADTAAMEALAQKDTSILFFVTSLNSLAKFDASGNVVTIVSASGGGASSDVNVVYDPSDGTGDFVKSVTFSNDGSTMTITMGTFDTNFPSYTLKKLTTAEGSALASYSLVEVIDGVETTIGDKINLPADIIVKSGAMGTVAAANDPYTGAAVGDLYIDITLTNDDHIYIPANGLVSPIAAGDGINVIDNTVSLRYKASSGLAIEDGALTLAAATVTTQGAMTAEDKLALTQLIDAFTWTEV